MRCCFRKVCVACAALWVVTVALPARGAVVFAPPDDVGEAATELKGIERELSEGNAVVAARRLDALLKLRAGPLAALGEGSLTSAAAWLDGLAAQPRAALAGGYAKAFGEAAAGAVAALRKDRTARPEEFYAVARRYPLTAAAGDALAEAGDRAAALGDLAAAQTFYEMALRADAPLGEGRARRLEGLKRINAGTAAPVPADLIEGTAAAAGDRRPFAGLLPFDAAWFGNASLAGMARFFPAAYDDRIILATWRGVGMYREDGQIVWHAPNPKAPGAFAVERPAAGARAVPFAPAVLADAHGRPLIVVARQPTVSGEAGYALRGISAANGKLLWSTDSSADGRKDLSYVGLPAVAGRYVYAVAVVRTGYSTCDMVLSAVDVATGQPLWETPIGSMTEQGDGGARGKNVRNLPLSTEAFAELGEPAVAGDVVVVSPNCGAVIAVGRFDGQVRWVHTYAGTAERVRARDWDRGPVNRYRSTPAICGRVVVVLPQDDETLFALDVGSGRRLWDNRNARPPEGQEPLGVAGTSGDVVVLGGPTVYMIDARGGKTRWTYAPARERVTGPAAVMGNTMVVPTTAGFVQIDLTTGDEHAAYAVPSFRRFLASDGGRAAVNEAGAARAFGAAGKK